MIKEIVYFWLLGEGSNGAGRVWDGFRIMQGGAGGCGAGLK